MVLPAASWGLLSAWLLTGGCFSSGWRISTVDRQTAASVNNNEWSESAVSVLVSE